MEKAYQSNFAPAIQPSTQPHQNETDYVKGYFTPPPSDLWKSGEKPQHSTPCVGNTLKADMSSRLKLILRIK